MPRLPLRIAVALWTVASLTLGVHAVDAAPRKHKKKPPPAAAPDAGAADTAAAGTNATTPAPAATTPPPSQPPPPPPETVSPSTPPALAASPGAPDMTKRLTLSLDIVVGFGNVTALNTATNVATGVGTVTTKSDTRVTSDSYVLGAEYWTTDNARLGLRLPLAHASYDPTGLDQRHTSGALGDIELALSYWKPLTPNASVTPSIAVALPTSSGNELPPAVDVNDKLPVDQVPAYDRHATLNAASAARGFEENQLFADKRLGVVPRIGLDLRVAPRLLVSPFIKNDNLIGIVGSLAHGYVGDVVGGAAAAYSLAEWVDVALRAWVSFTYAGWPDLDSKVLAVAEPQLRFHLGVLQPTVGLLVPFAPIGAHDLPPPASVTAGPPADPTFDPRFFAVRIAAAARF